MLASKRLGRPPGAYSNGLRVAAQASVAMRRGGAARLSERGGVLSHERPGAAPRLSLRSFARLCGSESADPSQEIRVRRSESADPSRQIRVSRSESADPSQQIRVRRSESGDPSQEIRVRRSESGGGRCPVRTRRRGGALVAS